VEHWTEYTRSVTALIIIREPLAAVPLFLGLTHGLSNGQHRRGV